MNVCCECEQMTAPYASVLCAGQYEGTACEECAPYLGTIGFDVEPLPPMIPPREGARMPRVKTIGYGHAGNILELLSRNA